MHSTLGSAIWSVILFAGMLVLLRVGRWLGRRHIAKDTTGEKAGTAAVESAVFALLGLLVAFTFSGAASRFDARRQLIGQETNDIGTAYLRLDLLPAEAQPAMRELFRQYLDARLATYEKLPDIEAAQAEFARSGELQARIWKQAITATQASSDARAAMLLVPSLNAMFDIATTRKLATLIHPPAVIYWLLFLLGLGCALLAGYDMAETRSPSLTHRLAFAAIVAVTFYVILDLEHPRLGLIRVDAADALLIDLRASMK